MKHTLKDGTVILIKHFNSSHPGVAREVLAARRHARETKQKKGAALGGHDARSKTGQAGGVPPRKTTAAQPTVAELRAECKRKGLRNYSKLKKDELVRLLKGVEDVKIREPRLEDLTLQQLRDECRRRGMKGFSKLKKEDLIQRMKDCALEKEKQKQRDRKKVTKKKAGRGPLNARAQERFDAGPTSLDTPGFLYIYYQPDDSTAINSNLGSSQSGVREWKIGKTTLDPPERRMQQSAGRNGKTYKLRASWRVPWCGFVEKVVHLDLEHLRVFPAKDRSNGEGTEDGGTEWFRADITLIEARVLLALRMVRSRAADEANTTNGLWAFCGVFRCGLPLFSRSSQNGGEDRNDGKVGQGETNARLQRM